MCIGTDLNYFAFLEAIPQMPLSYMPTQCQILYALTFFISLYINHIFCEPMQPNYDAEIGL